MDTFQKLFKTKKQCWITERHYGDGWPRWINCPSAVDAISNREALIKRLRREPFCSNYADTEILAEALANCRLDNRCGSMACPECARAAQRFFVLYLNAAILTYLDKCTRACIEPSIFGVTVIPSSARTAPGQLNTKKARNALGTVKGSLRQAMTSLPAIDFGVFAFDFSLNDDTQKNLGIFWQPHFHGIILGNERHLNRNDVAEELLARFPSSTAVSKPVRIQSYKATFEGLSYLLKPTFWGRSSYLSTDNQKRAPFWNTRGFRLRADAHIEISLLMDFLDLRKRILWHGIERPDISFPAMGPKSPPKGSKSGEKSSSQNNLPTLQARKSSHRKSSALQSNIAKTVNSQ